MKELSIEEKAKAYDKAIERAKSKLHYPDRPCFVNVPEIFPELAESEDERTRKEIINYLEKNCRLEWAAWLEKQEGCEYIKKDWLEHIKQSWYKEGFINGKYSGGTSKELTINDSSTLKELIDFLENGTAKLQHDLTKYANWLKIQFTPTETQGKQKSVNDLTQQEAIDSGYGIIPKEREEFQNVYTPAAVGFEELGKAWADESKSMLEKIGCFK